MTRSKPAHHQMVRSLWAKVKNMEELSRRTGIPVNVLWRAYKNEGARLRTWGSRLEEYYYSQFPDCHFSAFFERRDERLQRAFQLAVAKDKTRDTTVLRELFIDDWPLLSGWCYPEDKAGECYLRARYALVSGWTGISLDPKIDRCAALQLAIDEADLCLASLERDPGRLHQPSLKMKGAKLRIAAAQRLHLLKHDKHMPLTDAIGRLELKCLLDYFMLQVTTWDKGHFNRWQLARDAVTISSALALLDECSQAYDILLEERPDFADPNHAEWTVGPAADDPDLKFFRENFDTICKPRSKLWAA